MKKFLIVVVMLISGITYGQEFDAYINTNYSTFRSSPKDGSVCNFISVIPRFTKIKVISSTLYDDYIYIKYLDTYGFIKSTDIFNSSTHFKSSQLLDSYNYREDENSLVSIDYTIIGGYSMVGGSIGYINNIYISVSFARGYDKNKSYELNSSKVGINFGIKVFPKVFLGTGFSYYGLYYYYPYRDVNINISAIPISLTLIDGQIGAYMSVSIPIHEDTGFVENYNIITLGVVFKIQLMK